MRSSNSWTQASIDSVRDITPTVREFSLRFPAGLPAVEPGSHLQVQLLVRGQPQTRSYSVVSQADASRCCIAVKRLDQGRGGSLVMWRLAVGDRLSVSAPQNHFDLALAAPAFLLVAGGIGVTPMVLMAQALARRGDPVRMLLGARTQEELAYLPVLQQALGSRLITAVSQRGEQLDFSAEIAALPAGGQIYVCGPVPMLDAVRRAWAAAGRPPADLRYETFGSSGRFAPQAFRLQVPRHGLDLTVPADTSLLEVLEAAGVQAIHDCRRGECGLCAMDVLALDGDIDHRDVFLSEHEKQLNQRICVCVSRVLGSITLDSAYRAGS
jgi:ferredoxin-NADP reductase